MRGPSIRPASAGSTNLVANVALCVGVAAALTGCGSDSSSSSSTPAQVKVADAAQACPALATATVPASAIGLASGGARVTSAVLVAANATAGSPEYCKVLGSVNPVNAADFPILFQLNLPSTWNTKAVQYGGGGFNGVVVAATGAYNHAPAGSPTPLALGYVTFGGDSGHSTPGGAFGTNATAFANYGGESVKRTRDAAASLANVYYKATLGKTYYIGGSKGGHEGLVAAQRYPADYDGVVAYYPAAQNLGLVYPWYRMSVAAYGTPGAALDPTKQALLKSKVLEACDALDGAADGIVSDTKSCRSTFAVNSLRCTGGTDTGPTCLSEAQINALLVAASPTEFAYPVANGVKGVGEYPIFLGGDVGGTLFDRTGTDVTKTAFFGFYDGVIRYWYYQDPSSTSANFDYLAWQPRVQQVGSIYDASNPNLDAFRAKGGKLLIIQGTTDMLVPPSMTSAYYDRVAARYGDAVKSFVRYYVQPGFGHAAGTFNMTWDSLGALDAWANGADAPSNPVAADANAATLGRTRPLCEYPLFPKYKGSGDLNSAANFTCVPG